MSSDYSTLLPVGSRWASSRNGWPPLVVVRHSTFRDGRPMVVVESEAPGRTQTPWAPSVLLAKRHRIF